ncbi:MAG: glycosyltransferase [Candidatus Methanomethylicia archaeon]
MVKVTLIGAYPWRMTRLKLVASSLRKYGFNVNILFPKFNVKFKPRFISASLRYLSYMIQELFVDSDVIHVFNVPDVYGLPPLLKKKFKNIKLIYDVRSPWGDELADLGYKSLHDVAESIERILTVNASAVTTVNSILGDRARKWGARKVYVIPNYPSREFKPSIDPKEFKCRLGLENYKIILFVGAFTSIECALDIINVFPRVIKEVADTILIMVGDGILMPEIKRRIVKIGIENKVILTGWIPHNEVANWISVADLCLAPRREWGEASKFFAPESVLKVNEYLALGKPVVVTPVGGFRNAPSPPFIIAPFSRLDEAIINALRKPFRVENPLKYTWNTSEKNLIKAYDEVLKED